MSRSRKHRAPLLVPGTRTTRNGGGESRDGREPVVEREAAPLEPAEPISWQRVALWSLLFVGLGIWAYWPTLVVLVTAWEREADYSHGYLVVPLALCFAWARRDRFPGVRLRYAWFGLFFVAAGCAARVVGALLYLDALDGWSITVWLFGVIWVLFGPRVAWWSAPSVGFLLFMVPLPFAIERSLSIQLQGIATKVSVASLQMLGQPALAEGNVILLGDHRLEVAQACSGLRIFMGIVALAYAYFIMARRPWWQKLFIPLAICPIALVSNATRIVLTGLLYQYVSGKAAQSFSHDFAGWLMIPLAAALFGLLLWYLGKLVNVVTIVDPRRQAASDEAPPPPTTTPEGLPS